MATNVPLYAQGNKQAAQYSTEINKKNAAVATPKPTPKVTPAPAPSPKTAAADNTVAKEKLKKDVEAANAKTTVNVPLYAQGTAQATQYSNLLNQQNANLAAPVQKSYEQLFKEAQQSVQNTATQNVKNAPTAWVGALLEPTASEKEQMAKELAAKNLGLATPTNAEAGWSVPSIPTTTNVPLYAQGNNQATAYSNQVNAQNKSLSEPVIKPYEQLFKEAQQNVQNTATQNVKNAPTDWVGALLEPTAADKEKMAREMASQALTQNTPVSKDAGWSVPNIPPQVNVPQYAQGNSQGAAYSNQVNAQNEQLAKPLEQSFKEAMPTSLFGLTPQAEQQKILKDLATSAYVPDTTINKEAGWSMPSIPSAQQQVQTQVPIVVPQYAQDVTQQKAYSNQVSQQNTDLVTTPSKELPTVKQQESVVEQQQPASENKIIRATALPEDVPTIKPKTEQQTTSTAIDTSVQPQPQPQAQQTTQTQAQPQQTDQQVNLAKRSAIAKRPFSYGEYVDLLDTIGDDKNLSSEEQSYLNNARQQIFADKGLLEKEMLRAQNKIMDRKAQNLDTSAQEAYYTTLDNEYKKFTPIFTPEEVKSITSAGLGGIIGGIETGTGSNLTEDNSKLVQEQKKLGVPTIEQPTVPTAEQPTVPTAEQPNAPNFMEQPKQTLDEMYRALATKQVQENIDRQNADLDLQIKQAQESRDFGKEEQLRAYKNAVNQINNQSFLSGLQQMQQYANRGLLGSGLSEDALTRLAMSGQQQLAQLAGDYQSKLQQASMNYNQTLERINKAKADLESGRAKDVEATTKQLIADQQAADKYKAEILKQQADQRQAEAKQAFDYVKLVADQNGIDVTGLLGYAANGDIGGMIKALQATKNPALSLAGEQLQQSLAQKQATANAQITADKARASQIWSELNGYISDENGKPILKNGKIQKTQSAIEAESKLALDKQKAAQAGAKSTGKTTTTKPATTKPMTIPQQQDYVTQAISPLLTVNYDKNTGRKTGETLDTVNVGKFNDTMEAIYKSGLVRSDVIKTIYNAYKVPLPSWFSFYKDSSTTVATPPSGTSSTGQAFQFLKDINSQQSLNAKNDLNKLNINPNWYQ